MKKIRLPFLSLASFLLLLFFSACSTQKQVFYFNSAPAIPKVTKQVVPAEPIYTASTSLTPVDLDAVETNDAAADSYAMSKKKVRNMLKAQIRALKDTIKRQSGNKQVTVLANPNRVKALETDVKAIKKSVRVETGKDKVVVNYRQPNTQMSDSTKILLAIAAALILVLLFSIPVIGGLLAVILALAVIAVALALILGIIEIHQS